MKISSRFIKQGIGIIICNPELISSILTRNFNTIYCSYFQKKVKLTKKLYHKYERQNELDLFEKVKKINAEIQNHKFSRHEAYFGSLYCIIRELKPAIVIETGVHRGVSSLFILEALNDNKKGKLYSIDLPLASYTIDTNITTTSTLPVESIGICIPSHLRPRWELILENSKKVLPSILDNVESLDIFIHDSEHTYDHMMWEFETVWPHLIKNGIIVSDDTSWNNAFEDFSLKMNAKNLQLSRDKSYEKEKFGILIKN